MADTARDFPLPLLRALAEGPLDFALMVLDTEGRVTWWSPGSAHIFGYSAAEIVGSPAARLFTPEDVELGIHRQEMAIATASSSAEDDRWQLRKDGSRFWANGIMVAVRDEAGAPVAFVKALRNRTDLKGQLEALKNRIAELEAAAHRKDVFLATLSHELRNPLAPLANAVGIIRVAAPPSDDVEYALRVVERQMALLQRLVDDVLDLSRAGAGKIELRRERLALTDVVRAAVDAMRAQAAERRQLLELLPAEAPLTVEGDRDRLHQVFVNLVGNAVKYTEPGGHIVVKATAEGSEAVVKVQDDGIGIPHDMLPRIFDLFTQVESSRPRPGGGLGIGLAVVRNLVSLHGGTVQVLSDGPGKGSEFSVRLPLAS